MRKKHLRTVTSLPIILFWRNLDLGLLFQVMFSCFNFLICFKRIISEELGLSLIFSSSIDLIKNIVCCSSRLSNSLQLSGLPPKFTDSKLEKLFNKATISLRLVIRFPQKFNFFHLLPDFPQLGSIFSILNLVDKALIKLG